MTTTDPGVEARPQVEPPGQLAVIPNVESLDLMADPARYVIAACERAKTWLVQALEHGDIDQIVELKSQAEAIRIYTMQKQLAKDAQLSAMEIVRRAERGLGVAVRKGQDAGVIRSKRDGSPGTSSDYLRNGKTVRAASSRVTTKPSPGQFFKTHDEWHDVYAMTDGVTDEQFEDSVADAKTEGNLSRANVIRKIKGQQRASERPEMLKGTRHHNPERIINETVIALDGLCLGLTLLEPRDFDSLDPQKVEDWSSSLRASLRILNQLAKGLNRARA